MVDIELLIEWISDRHLGSYELAEAMADFFQPEELLEFAEYLGYVRDEEYAD